MPGRHHDRASPQRAPLILSVRGAARRLAQTGDENPRGAPATAALDPPLLDRSAPRSSRLPHVNFTPQSRVSGQTLASTSIDWAPAARPSTSARSGKPRRPPLARVQGDVAPQPLVYRNIPPFARPGAPAAWLDEGQGDAAGQLGGSRGVRKAGSDSKSRSRAVSVTQIGVERVVLRRAVDERSDSGGVELACDGTPERPRGSTQDARQAPSFAASPPAASFGHNGPAPGSVTANISSPGDSAPATAHSQTSASRASSTRASSSEVGAPEAPASPSPQVPQAVGEQDADGPAQNAAKAIVIDSESDDDSARWTSSLPHSASASPQTRSSSPVSLADFLASSRIRSTRSAGSSRPSKNARPRGGFSTASFPHASHDLSSGSSTASSFASSSRVQVHHPIFDAVEPAAAGNVEAGLQPGGFVGAGGDGDDPFAYFLHRMTMANPEFYPSEHVAAIVGDEGAIDAAKRAIERVLHDIEAQGREAAESAWGAEPEDVVSVHFAFGTAREGPAKWFTGLNMPLARRNDSTTLLSKLPDIQRLVVIGADGISDNLVALRDEFLSRMQPDAEICFTIKQSRGKAIRVTVQDLLAGVETRLAEEDEEDVEPDVVQLLDVMVDYGLTRRVGQSKAAQRHGGELHRKRRTTRSRPKARRGAHDAEGASRDDEHDSDDEPAPRRKFARTFEHAEPTNWHLYERCGLNDCPFVNLTSMLPQHRQGAFCWGRCPEGCDISTGGAFGKRQHIASQHPRRALCALPTCPMSYAAGRSQTRNLDNHGEQHRQGSY